MPVSGHFDGSQFFNPGGTGPAGFPAIARWSLTRRRAPWPDHIVNPPFPPPGPVPPGHAGVTFIGHSTFLLRLPGPITILTDPVWSERCSPVSFAGPRRVRAPGLALDALPHVDIVLVSHNHYDHMDLPTLRALQDRFRPQLITTLGNAALLERAGIPGAAELDWWQSMAAGPLVITATPARHFSARGLTDRNRTLWAGLHVRSPEGSVLFAGDSGDGPHWAEIGRRLGPPGLALLPIGAYEPRSIIQPMHMNPAEAVRARAALGAPRAIGMHFGTFQLTDEAVGAPEGALAAAREAAGLDSAAFDTLGFGESRLVPLSRSG